MAASKNEGMMGDAGGIYQDLARTQKCHFCLRKCPFVAKYLTFPMNNSVLPLYPHPHPISVFGKRVVLKVHILQIIRKCSFYEDFVTKMIWETMVSGVICPKCIAWDCTIVNRLNVWEMGGCMAPLI